MPGVPHQLKSIVLIAICIALGPAVGSRADDETHDSHDQCEMCHTEHFSQSHTWNGGGIVSVTPRPDGDWLGTNGPNPALLRTSAGNNELCVACHQTPPSTATARPRTFTGVAAWSRSSHANASVTCVACHNPHGVTDEQGLVGARLRAREPQPCLQCHPSITAQSSQMYVHGARAPGAHDPLEADDPARYAAAPVNQRHAACSDCHNSHEANRDPAPPQAPEASSRLAAVSRVEVLNGGAGAAPAYRWRAADEPGPVNEYEICFKCHSSWTTQPQGQADLALLTNPANASYHPIQARGRNTGIDPAAFVNGYAADSVVRCTDCHASDDTTARGPHGSSNAHLLRKPAATSSMPETARPTDLCFECHAFAAYADSAAPETVLRASRFNGPATSGHTIHVGVHRIVCYSCHETHGSVLQPSLIATGRGINSWLPSSNGGTCATSCHATKTYTGNYPR